MEWRYASLAYVQRTLDARKRRRTVSWRHRQRFEKQTSLNYSTESTIISDGSKLRNALHSNTNPIPTINQSIPFVSSKSNNHIDIDRIIKKYTLNTEQARAFKLVCEQSLNHENGPLWMYLGGAGGTGRYFFLDCRFSSKRSLLDRNMKIMIASHHASGVNVPGIHIGPYQLL